MDQKVEISSQEVLQTVLPPFIRGSMRWGGKLVAIGAFYTIAIFGGVLGAGIAEISKGTPPENVLPALTQPGRSYNDVRSFNQIIGFSVGFTAATATSLLMLKKIN